MFNIFTILWILQVKLVLRMVLLLLDLLVHRFRSWFLLFSHRLDSLHLSLGKTILASTHPKIRLFWLVIFLPMDFDYSHVHAFSHLFLGWICFKLYFFHWSDEYAFSLFFFALSLFQGKIIDVTSPRPEIFIHLGP